MKRHLPIVLSLVLCHCGTEVGNGIAPRDPNETEGSSDTPTSTPPKGEGSNSGAPGSVSSYGFPSAFLAACASPFSEPIEGAFSTSSGSASFRVTLDADGKKTLSREDGSLMTVITPAPASGTYAIEALSGSPQVDCGEVSSRTLDNGQIERTVTLTDNTRVQWTLSEGKVSVMTFTSSTMTTETWSKK
jgi:hypothetical protein